MADESPQLGFLFSVPEKTSAAERIASRESIAAPRNSAVPEMSETDVRTGIEARVPLTPKRRLWAVADLVAAVRGEIEREYADVWLQGEVSNYRPAPSGHLYFTLKDDAAQLRVVMFRSQARLLRFRLENGMAVLVRGRVTVYDARGELQLYAEHMEPQGAGALQLAFEQLKARLQAEGLFDAARKRPLPALPRTIGLITSASGSVLQDFLQVLRRRHYSANVLIYPAQVQGESAAAEVAAGIRWLNSPANKEESVDVIVIARGGGSAEDLAAFNDEALGRVAAESRVPLISAVGHETDFTILDFVADLRAPTPSAAAEMVIRSRQEIEDEAEALHRRLARAAEYQLLLCDRKLTALAQHGAFARMGDVLARRRREVVGLESRLEGATRRAIALARREWETASSGLRHQDPRLRLHEAQRELAAKGAALQAAMRHRLNAAASRVESLGGTLGALSPLAILDRGYSLVFDAQGNLLKDAAQVKAGDEIRARLSKGEVRAGVK